MGNLQSSTVSPFTPIAAIKYPGFPGFSLQTAGLFHNRHDGPRRALSHQCAASSPSSTGVLANRLHHQNIATITLNNPEKLNALDLDGYFLLGSLLRQVAEMSSVTITLITGTGRYFSASVPPALPLQLRA
jgi:hypothetical protein